MLSVLRAPAPLASLSRAAIRPVMSAAAAAMTEEESFLFDLNGFLVVRGVFTAEEVAAANAAVDAHAAEELKARDAAALRNAKSGTPMAASGPRMDMGGMLWWQADQSKLFRDMLTHPRLVPYYRALCGEGYRMDHQPLLVAQGPDSEGFKLHGGPISGADGVPQGVFNPELQYRCVHGQLWTSLLAASVQLCDHQPGDGGFCIVRGSHKLNLPVPTDFADGVGSAFAEHIHHPATRAGDVVLWSEATVHGATPWRAERERRIAIYRFAPPNMGYGRGYLDIPPGAMEGLTPLQRAVLEPPYATRLERPLVTASAAAEEDGATEAVRHLRSDAKKEHDRQTLGTAYF